MFRKMLCHPSGKPGHNSANVFDWTLMEERTRNNRLGGRINNEKWHGRRREEKKTGAKKRKHMETENEKIGDV